MDNGWMKLTRVLGGAALVLVFGACDRSDTARVAPSETPEPPGGIETTGTGTTTLPLGVADVSMLDDDERAAVARAIDDRIVAEAELAENNAGSDDVKQVAHELVVLHRENRSDDQAIWHERLDATETPVQRQLASETASSVELLRELRGAAFDRELLDEEIRAHREGISLVDRLLPGVIDANLETEILRSRPALTIYLETLTRLQRGAGVAEMQGTAPARKSPR